MNNIIDLNFAKYWLIKKDCLKYVNMDNVTKVYVDEDFLIHCIHSDIEFDSIICSTFGEELLKDYKLSLFLKDMTDDEFKSMIERLEKLKEILEVK